MIFTEFGFGNESIISTEIENEFEEYRINRLIIKKIISIYIRIWILRKVLIIDTKEGVKLKNKNRNQIKFLIGIQSN